VHISVGLYTATQDNDISFNLLCKEDNSRIKYKKVCAHCGKEVQSSDIVKRFEYEKDKYVIMSDDDFVKAKTEKDKSIQILHFTDLQAIRSIYYELAKKQELEGIVAKKKDSKYYFGKRTKDWIKIKYLLDDDFVVCGYILKDNNMTSLVLGKYNDDLLLYKGHVTLGVSGSAFGPLSQIKQIDTPLFHVPPGNEDAVWLEPNIVCTVKFMIKTANGGMRQPVFKGLRIDKQAKDCIE